MPRGAILGDPRAIDTSRRTMFSYLWHARLPRRIHMLTRVLALLTALFLAIGVAAAPHAYAQAKKDPAAAPAKAYAKTAQLVSRKVLPEKTYQGIKDLIIAKQK